MKTSIVVAILCGMFMAATAVNTSAGIIFSDDFESDTLGTQSTSLDNWSITDGSVDVLGLTLWPQYTLDGQSLDMDGSTGDAGTIESTAFALNTSLSYIFTFDLEGNRRSGTDSMAVSIADWSETFTLAHNEPRATITRALTFSDITSNFITFAHGGGDNVGMLLDNVKLQTDAVPEPATMLLFGTGLVGLVGSRLRKKNK